MKTDPASGFRNAQAESQGAGFSPERRTRRFAHRWTPLVVMAVLSLAGFLLYRTLSRYNLEDIIASVALIPLSRLMLAGIFAAASYLCLSGFDYLALHYVGKPLAYPKAALASFTSLSLGHNIGLAFLSSGAVRYRFYSRWGLSVGEVAKVIAFCGVTVGLGLATLGGAALLLRSGLARDITGLPRSIIIIPVGAFCLAAVAGYLVFSAMVRRPFTFWNWSFEAPSLRLAVGQIAIGSLNFAFVAACLHQVLAAVTDIAYGGVASVYVIANATALVSHVPGGLGVIESVVMYLLPQADLIGALVAFRVVYFLVPLALGGISLAISEVVFRRCSATRAAADEGAPPA